MSDNMVYRNVYQFSGDVPETAHDGHKVRVGLTYAPDLCDSGVKMANVYCYKCEEHFSAFIEELESIEP